MVCARLDRSRALRLYPHAHRIAALARAGAHVRSAGAIRTFWFFTLLSIFVDLLWLFVYSPLRPIAFDTILALSRKDQVRAHARALLAESAVMCVCSSTDVPPPPACDSQLSLMLSVLNTAYKVLVVWTAVSLTNCFTQRDALIEQMEIDAGVKGATTSSGAALDARSLAAQEAGR